MSSGLILDSKTYHLSSRSSACQLQNGDYKSKMIFNIPDMIERDDSIEYIEYSIPYCIVPNSFYTVNETNNTLIITENAITTTYVFETGNYNANLFITKFKSLLGFWWNITLDTISSCFIITNALVEFQILSGSTIDSVMGFSGNLSSINRSITMPRVCNFLPLPRITMRCPELANGVMVSAISSGDVILSIPNNSKIGGEIVYQNNTTTTLFRGDRLHKLTISFTNDDGDAINFNGISSFFTLQFNIYRKPIEKPPKFSDIVNMVNNHYINQQLQNQTK